MSEYLSHCIKKAERYLANAQVVASTEYPAGAVTSSYYAFFWLVRGLLYEKNITTKRHSGAREMFALHYIKSGEIQASFYDDFETLFDKRQLADYDLDGDFDHAEVLTVISISNNFLDFVKEKYA